MALLLFVIFAVCILAVLFTGADNYKKIVDRNRISYDRRIAVSFLTTKVRQGDLPGAIDIRQVQGQDVLILKEEINGASYETWIYCYDGMIRELFTAAGSGLSLEAGTPILKAEELQFWWKEDPGKEAVDQKPADSQGRLLRIKVTTGGDVSDTWTLKLRSGEEVGP